jgi:acetoin utilization deacetylase AcuC-like enzyme
MSVDTFFLLDDPSFDAHAARGYHPERPERLSAARRGVARAEACAERPLSAVPVPARDATDDELARAHDAAYVEALARLEGRYAALDADTFVAPASVGAARRAAGGTVALVDALLGLDAPRRGVALVRPPGHHATPSRGMGFCLLNNAAVGAAHALARGLERVAIVDWDVHHGNGTQDIFYADPRVLYVSLHQAPLYPGTGDVSELGAGDGQGHTVNIPLSPEATPGVYAAAFEQVVLPVLDLFAPELVIISAGFDAHERDPLASMRLSDEAYGSMARALSNVAERTAKGRVVLLLEGGYDLTAIEGSMAASVQGLFGHGAALSTAQSGPGGAREHAAEIARARGAAREHWKIG